MINRRNVIGTGLALAATPALAKDGKVSFAVPDGATDCHHHIYDPRFPYNPKAVLTPLARDKARNLGVEIEREG